jgi:hypothetical protein
VWQLERFDPAGASQMLHELPLTGIRSFHFLALRISTKRRDGFALEFCSQTNHLYALFRFSNQLRQQQLGDGFWWQAADLDSHRSEGRSNMQR